MLNWRAGKTDGMWPTLGNQDCQPYKFFYINMSVKTGGEGFYRSSLEDRKLEADVSNTSYIGDEFKYLVII